MMGKRGSRAGIGEILSSWLEHIEKVWREPDESICEVRGARRQFTYSKLMAWVAFDRAVKGFEAGAAPRFA
jgi:GH15 family glucan-1,4-alpha-glucosidase